MKGPVVKAQVNVLVAIFCAAVLLGCSHHRPAPVEEQSRAHVKRQLNADGTYRVRPGDTLYAIAFGYGLDHRDIAAWNGISRPYVIYPGQNLHMSAPSHKVGKSSTVQTAGIKTPAKATTRAHTSGLETKAAKKPSTRPAAGKPPAKQASRKASPKPASANADPAAWKWPASGRILRGYVAGNPSRKGLDIEGKEGQPITASAAGKVVYSGSGLIGYGELIIIKHSEKMLSAYAHNKVRLVQEGDQVSAGQKIAEMGRNDQNEQILHFEIRAHGKPVNPAGYLPKK